jgi:hypothetical protein
MRTVCLWMLVACGPVNASVIAADGIPDPDDTGSDTGDTGDTGVDTGDTGGDTGEPEPDPTIQVWEGFRFFDFGECEAEVGEKGFLDLNSEAAAACPQCTYVFQVEVAPDRICGIPVRNPVFRGVQVQGRRATLFFIDQTDRGFVAAPIGEVEAEQQGFDWFIEYAYEGNLGNGRTFEVGGEARLIAQ